MTADYQEALEAKDDGWTFEGYLPYADEQRKTFAQQGSLPTIEERLKAAEDAIMAMALGGTSNV